MITSINEFKKHITEARKSSTYQIEYDNLLDIAEEHGSKAHSILRDVLRKVSPNLTKNYRKPSAVQQKQIDDLLKDTQYAHHIEQEEFYNAKAEDFYNKHLKEGEEKKRAENQQKFKEIDKENRRNKAEKLKAMSNEDKTEIERLQNRLNSLRHHHSYDSINFGISIGEERQKIKNSIDKIKNKYLN